MAALLVDDALISAQKILQFLHFFRFTNIRTYTKTSPEPYKSFGKNSHKH